MDDEGLKKRLIELSRRAEFTGQKQFTDFLTLSELSSAKGILSGQNAVFFGGTEDAERKMIGIAASDDLLSPEDFPLVGITIEQKSPKFSEDFTHRDVLGSVLGLGIDRSVIGDLYVDAKQASLFCSTKIASFLLENLTKVKRAEVICHLRKETSETLFKKTTVIHETVASLRLDVVLSAVFHGSRSKSSTDITSGKVQINGREELAASTRLMEQDVISYRGHGKFRLKEIGGLTKKERINVMIEMFE